MGEGSTSAKDSHRKFAGALGLIEFLGEIIDDARCMDRVNREFSTSSAHSVQT